MTLLTVGNPKTSKGTAYGYHTAVLHLAPANLSGHEVCPKRTKGCTSGCLNTAGRGGIFKTGETTNAIQEARIRRTRFLFSDRDAFVDLLSREIAKHAHEATRLGLRPCVRLNGTSDLDWSQIAPGMIRERAAVSGVRFYDYTKRLALFDAYASAGLPIHLTFSLAETRANRADAWSCIAGGRNVAVVFDTKRVAPLPSSFHHTPVIDGDEHDLRFLDPAGVVVGLRANGRARRDASGFVVRA